MADSYEEEDNSPTNSLVSGAGRKGMKRSGTEHEHNPSPPQAGRQLDILLEKTGYGTFHIFLLIVCGWALASDSVEVSSVSFVTPVLEDNTTDAHLHPTKFQSGALDSIIFLGMMFGGYFWGGLADIIGRRVCLILSLVVNGVFGLTSSLSPNFPAFMVFRFGSGFGVGGSVPIVFSYFSEFFSTRFQGGFIIVLASFWTVGRLYASFLAWIVIPRYINISIGSMEFTSWRVFLALCTLPCFLSALAILGLPESPGYLFTKGKFEQVKKVVHRINKCQCAIIRKQPVALSMDEKEKEVNASLDSITHIPVLRERKTFKEKARVVWAATVQMFKPPYLRPTVVMIIVFFTLSFGYYGLVLWFPEYFKYIESQSCSSDNSTSECSSTSYRDNKIYLDNLYASLATIPGIVFGLLFINILGSKVLLVLSMVVSALSTFAIWGVPKRASYIVILSCIFTGFSTIGWIALDVIIPELFPVHLRSTSFGLLSAVGRIGSIIGILLFGRLITVSPFLPILIVAALLIFGGLTVFIVPEKKRLPISRFCHCLCIVVKNYWKRSYYEGVQ